MYHPALHLSLHQAPAGWLEPQVNQEDEDGLITSTLRLRFSLQRQLLEYGDVQVACVAEIPNVYREEARDILSTRPPYQASVLGAAPIGQSILLYCISFCPRRGN